MHTKKCFENILNDYIMPQWVYYSSISPLLKTWTIANCFLLKVTEWWTLLHTYLINTFYYVLTVDFWKFNLLFKKSTHLPTVVLTTTIIKSIRSHIKLQLFWSFIPLNSKENIQNFHSTLSLIHWFTHSFNRHLNTWFSGKEFTCNRRDRGSVPLE